MSAATNLETPFWQQDKLKLSLLWYGLLLLPLAGIMAFVILQPVQVLPRISLAPGYSFVDQDGNRFSNDQALGKLILYNFAYTGCGEACTRSNAAMQEMQQLAAEIEAEGLSLEFVTISFDPEKDTPERLNQMATDLGADTDIWHFVTGDPAHLKNVIGAGFSTYFDRNEDGSFTFDPAFALVDGLGILRAKYRTAEPGLDLIRRDLNLLASEIRNSEGANRYVYEAAHLFLCYPK